MSMLLQNVAIRAWFHRWAMQVKAAEAEAESKYLSGVGVSRQRKAIVDGLRDSVQNFAEAIDGAKKQGGSASDAHEPASISAVS